MSKVIKLAQPGYNVNTAGDENLIYNSNWPLLKIYQQGSFSSSDNATEHQLVTNHDLGYPPAFWFFSNQPATDWYSDTGTQSARSEFNGPVQGLYPGVTDTKLVFDINPGFVIGTVKFEWYIFAIDLTVPYTAPQVKTGGVGGGESTIKFKVAKSSKDISSTRLEDYVIHSDARSPLIHAVYPAASKADSSFSTGYGFTFYHNLGYVPMFFAYRKWGVTNNPTSNKYTPYLVGPGGGGGDYFIVDEKKISYVALQADVDMSLLILKDPFNADYSVKVSI